MKSIIYMYVNDMPVQKHLQSINAYYYKFINSHCLMEYLDDKSCYGPWAPLFTMFVEFLL